MKGKYKEVPITAAALIAEKYDKQEVIVLAIDRDFDKVHVTTYGVTKQCCKNAEVTGAFLREVLEIEKPDIFFEQIEQAKKIYFARRAADKEKSKNES